MMRVNDTQVMRLDENATGGRDFVVGDVHGEFDALERILAQVEFRSDIDRLFGLGDLIDRGPQSTLALVWMETGRITLSVRGNHEQMLLERMESVENDPDDRRALEIHEWFTREVPREEWGRWKTMIRRMPFAATLRTRAGPIGLVHASPTTRHWETMLEKLAAGDTDTMWIAINSTARARNDARRAEFEGIPAHGSIDGVRAVVTGHAIFHSLAVRANVYHIDTGAGSPHGRLTLARVDTDPIETVTMHTNSG